MAAGRTDQIPEAVKKARSEALIALAERCSKKFRKDYIGREVEVLFEEGREINGIPCQVGYTGEYIRAVKKTSENLSGKVCRGKLTGFLEDDTLSGNRQSDNLLWFV